MNPNEVIKKHPGGRPRTYDREWLRDQLAEWSLKPESVVLTQFCDEYSIASTKVQDFAREDIEFRTTLRIARDRLASRREIYFNQGTIQPASYNRYVKHYDGFLKDDENEDAKLQAQVKAELGVPADTTYNFKVNFGNSVEVPSQAIPDKSPPSAA